MNSDSAVADAYDRRADEYIEIAGRIEQLDPRDADTIRVWRDATAGPLLDAGCGPPDDVPEVLAEFARVIAPGGSLLLGFFDGAPREPFAHAVAPAYFWSPEALGALLENAGLTVAAVEQRGRAPGEASARPHAAVTAVRAA
ncbi:hypothetical protein [Microbacterium sp. XT11]|uniref:hypothetical protein n=1 Tax=Microbacterium sp. XT11 TaxID=367477 RepID=UPI0008321213|nr:hypothetical protein [Microbacterium sp. XT11]